MHHSRRFVPLVEALEPIQLLATYSLNIARFDSHPILLDTSDPTAHTAWAFSGMEFGILVYVPSRWMGFKSITYSFSPAMMDSTSYYTNTLGKPVTISSQTDTPIDPNNYRLSSDNPTLYAPMIAGLKQNVTISISVQAYINNPNGPSPPATDTLNDSITLKVEAPTVTSFVIADRSSPTTPRL